MGVRARDHHRDRPDRGDGVPSSVRHARPWCPLGRPIVAKRVDERGAPVPFEYGARDPVVTVKALTKRFGEIVAVDELTFSLRSGTVTGFLGPHGAGKTTTLRMLLGLAE